MKYTIPPVVKKYLAGLCCALMILSQSSCKKYLDKKTSQQYAIPSTLKDLLAILDNTKGNATSDLPELVADNYYLPTSVWNGLHADTRNQYIWARDARTTVENGDWVNPYLLIYQSNAVLELLPGIRFAESERSAYNNIKGTALFHRALMFYVLAQMYCRPYSNSAATDPGIVLRMTSDIDAPVARATVKETYEQVINDLKTATDLLPADVTYAARPGKAAAYGLLSRVYLSMRAYDDVEINATKALQISNRLLDYNSLSPAGNPALPVDPMTNPEILFLSWGSSTVFDPSRRGIVDSTLYRSYDVNDLRKTVFYGLTGTNPYWKGSYFANGATYTIFNGIATDELYLNRAEARARAGNTTDAMADLNALLVKRWKTGTFIDLTAISSAEALEKILVERRKELAFRGLRWTDLRRLNLEGANITLTRIINNTTYTLPPNDLRWVLLIPEIEVNRSGITQNPR
jgi:starch-binding outer membrane protein, SusD/RagB family